MTNTTSVANNNNATNSAAANNELQNQVVTDALEERLIDAEYKIWKKNTPYLYDFVLTHSLEWPSLTCQWLPNVKTVANATDCLEHNLLLGTHTTGEQNYLMVASCIIPAQDEAVIAEQNKLQEGKIPATTSASAPPRYDEEKKEIGGFGHASSAVVGKIEIKMKVKHEGEVNRARYMPQNPFIVATRGPSPELYLWDLSKHPSFPADNTTFSPQGVCLGHEKEGYAMIWSKHKAGHLLTGSEDATVRLWDVNVAINTKGANSAGTQIKPVLTLSSNGHTDTVEDVDWHYKDDQLVISVGDDKKICLWDLRDASDKTGPKHVIKDAHDSDINCVAFNPVNEHLFATGSADTTVAVWDIRNMSKRIHTLQSHTDQVFKVEWSPFNESILGSCSADRRIALWDLSRIGHEQCAEDAEDGPPELLFVHGGHTSKVSDFSWNAADHWTISSVSEDNVLQVWNIAEEIYANDDDDDNDEVRSSGAGEDGLLGEDELED